MTGVLTLVLALLWTPQDEALAQDPGDTIARARIVRLKDDQPRAVHLAVYVLLEQAETDEVLNGATWGVTPTPQAWLDGSGKFRVRMLLRRGVLYRVTASVGTGVVAKTIIELPELGN